MTTDKLKKWWVCVYVRVVYDKMIFIESDMSRQEIIDHYHRVIGFSAAISLQVFVHEIQFDKLLKDKNDNPPSDIHIEQKPDGSLL